MDCSLETRDEFICKSSLILKKKALLINLVDETGLVVAAYI